MIKKFKIFENSLYKLQLPLIDTLWDELWNKRTFYYPLKEPNLIFNSSFENDNMSICISIQKFSGENMKHINIGNRCFEGNKIDKENFIKWLYELNMVQ